MNNLYETLEVCLQDLEQGIDIETVLFRYPEYADELRPILEASVDAKSMAVPDPSPEVVRRNRARLLQHAAGLREAKVRPSSRYIWFASLRRLAVTLAVIAVLFASGTGLVRAASTTLPGDNLYPVKRTWEDVRLLFTFDLQQREALEIEHENERLEELSELFAKRRSAEVDFAGLVTRQNGDQWRVNGVPVVVSAQTEMPDQPVSVGSAVRVVGVTRGDGVVLAERIRLLPPGAKLPEVEHQSEGEEDTQGPDQQNEDNSGPGSEGESSQVEETRTPQASESGAREQSFEGVIESIDNSTWIIDGRPVDVRGAEIKGTPAVGAAVKVEGYFNSAGVFIVTKIEFVDGSSDRGSGSGADDNSSNASDNRNDNDNSSGESNDNGNDNSNDNGNDNSGGDDGGGNNGSGGDDGGNSNSGSGGGGDGNEN
ncbi:MAG TPA: DUF5666 domain-containing protein [Anaerolineales bacterium]|nr:DUF5666 domain-containing protein [Anaerolineales bacterium]